MVQRSSFSSINSASRRVTPTRSVRCASSSVSEAVIMRLIPSSLNAFPPLAFGFPAARKMSGGGPLALVGMGIQSGGKEDAHDLDGEGGAGQSQPRDDRPQSRSSPEWTASTVSALV